MKRGFRSTESGNKMNMLAEYVKRFLLLKLVLRWNGKCDSLQM